ncbi:hypothetical protein FD29_GL000965 [Companilactobacillus mindensis DSM 14500]|uniref:Uncharacterized protein n=1 Tax=Companilactobacillus mindensis DSM 14500 TaxID=1423770 RepID=A0A0R1QFN1_9LACO|nr:hypothetical protein FD29_GL000965 [Companilactobacillus mindensis DSM 14500]
MNHIAGMFRFLATTCKTVLEIPQRAEAQNASQKPRSRVFLAIFLLSSIKKYPPKKLIDLLYPSIFSFDYYFFVDKTGFYQWDIKKLRETGIYTQWYMPYLNNYDMVLHN